MSNIAYLTSIAGSQKVFVDDVHVGTIQPLERGWQFIPRGEKPDHDGTCYPSVEACKESLEGQL